MDVCQDQPDARAPLMPTSEQQMLGQGKKRGSRTRTAPPYSLTDLFLHQAAAFLGRSAAAAAGWLTAAAG